MIDLQPFCGTPGDSPPSIHKPFVIGGWCYATDRCICVRVPATGEAESKGKLPPADKLGWDHGEMARMWQLWPAPTAEKKLWTCDPCDGTGQVEVDVDVCGHFGICDTCQRCDGNGVVPYQPKVTLGLLSIDGYYDAKVRQLPNVQYFLDVLGRRVMFAFDGGEGILMPLADKQLEAEKGGDA